MDFDEFTRTGLRPLLQFARVLTGDRGLAEDVTQEVLIRQVHRVPDTVFGVGCAQAVLLQWQSLPRTGRRHGNWCGR